MLAAQQLLDKVHKEKPTLVESTRQLSEAYIELAYYSVTHLKKQQHGIDHVCKLPTILVNFYYSSCSAPSNL